MHFSYQSQHALLRQLGLVGLAAFTLFSAPVFAAKAAFGDTQYKKMGDKVNQIEHYPVVTSKIALNCTIDLAHILGTIDHRIFGTNLEWFNDGGGIASSDKQLRQKIINLTKQQGVSVMRYPGGLLADYYHWRDGIGPLSQRKTTKHASDSGASLNNFGSPEYFQFLKDTNSEGLVTVNVGTGQAQSAADWVDYTNNADNQLRIRDGFKSPMGIKLWEIGNELYLPGNPGEKSITLTPQQYSDKYLTFSRAMKKVDPSITTIAIGVAKSHLAPYAVYPDWSEVLLKRAGKEIDMIAVHNGYFPYLFHDKQPSVKDVYPALLAAPEAVDESLKKLESLLKKYEGKHHKIGIAITEWGGLFSLPGSDNYWVDHVKTMGSGIYVARMLQVMMTHPRVQLANYFKLTDRTFMGWINYKGEPKVPFWVFALYANHHGDQHLKTKLLSPTFDTTVIGIMAAQKSVPEVTVVASKHTQNGKVYVNIINRSLTTEYPINFNFVNGKVAAKGRVMRIQAKEITAHNGRDIPPEWAYDPKYEPYTTAPPNSIGITESLWNGKQPLKIAPFSVMTLVLKAQQ